MIVPWCSEPKATPPVAFSFGCVIGLGVEGMIGATASAHRSDY